MKLGDVVRQIGAAEIARLADVLPSFQNARIGDMLEVVVERQQSSLKLSVHFTEADITKEPVAEPRPIAPEPYDRRPLPAERSALIDLIHRKDRTQDASAEAMPRGRLRPLSVAPMNVGRTR